jgi:hypothetical protein
MYYYQYCIVCDCMYPVSTGAVWRAGAKYGDRCDASDNRIIE